MEDRIKQIVVAILAKARDDVRANMQAKGINASGRTSASIIVRETDTGVGIVNSIWVSAQLLYNRSKCSSRAKGFLSRTNTAS